MYPLEGPPPKKFLGAKFFPNPLGSGGVVQNFPGNLSLIHISEPTRPYYTMLSRVYLALAVGFLVRLAISRTVLAKWAKKSENREIWASFDPRRNFFLGEPPKFWNQFWVLLFRDYCQKNFGLRLLTPRGWEKILPPPKIFFLGEGPPKGYIS